MADDGKVVIELVGKDSATQTFVKSFQDMQQSINRLESTSRSSFSSINASVTSLVGGFQNLIATAGGLYILNRIWEGFKGIAESQHELEHMAERLGTTTGQLSELQYAAKKSGVEIEGFNTGITRFEKNLSAAALANEQADTTIMGVGESSNKAAQALRELGLSAEILRTLPLKDQVMALSVAMNNVPNDADKVRIGMDLFGRSAGNVITMLKQGPEALQGFIDRGKQLGVVIGDDVVARGAAAGVSLNQLRDALHGLAITATDMVAPGITKVVDGLTQKIVAARESGAATDVLNRSLQFLNALWSEPGLAAIKDGVIGYRLFGIQGAAIGAAAGFMGLHTSLEQVRNILNDPLVLTLFGAAAGSRLGTWGAWAGATAGAAAGIYRGIQKDAAYYKEHGRNREEEAEFEGYETTSDNPSLHRIKPTVTQPPQFPPGLFTTPTRAKPESGKGGGGADAEARRLASLYDTLMKDIARLSEGAWSEVEANLDKTLDQIYNRQEVRSVQETDLEVMARKRATLQKEQIEQDFWLMAAKESGNSFAEIDAQYNKDLKKYQGISGAKEQLDWIRQQKTSEAQQKIEKDTEDIHKSNLQAISQASPFLADQLAIEKQLLDTEINRNRADLELKLSRMQVSQETKDQLRAEQALADQWRRYALERKGEQLQGLAGGLSMGSRELQNTASTWQADQIAQWIKSAPQQISSYMAQSWIGGIKNGKTDLMAMFTDLGYSTAQTMAQKFLESWLNQVVPMIGNSLANLLGATPSGGGGGSGFLGWLSGLFGGGDNFSGYGVTGADAHGNAYLGGIRMAYARGGIFSSPHIFPMAHGWGLMGEAGPEAVMPLTRTSGGDLGIRAVGSSADEIKITLVNRSSAAPQLQATSQKVSDRDSMIFLDDAVGQVIGAGGKATQAVQSLNRGLTVR